MVLNRRFLASFLANSVRSVVAGLLLGTLPLGAQTNRPVAPIYPSNRYLLVVETSRTIQRDAGLLLQTVKDLLGSAFASQARAGDTLGVWTFDERLHTGRLPLQEWTPQNQQLITERIVGLLRAQNFAGPSRLESVLPPLLHLVKDSQFLTVVLVCAGDQPVRGTPFDQRINAFFQKWRQQQLEAKTPFVVALRAQEGRFVDCSMNPAPWPVELPALPKELFVALPPPRPPPPKSAPPKRVEVPPLIIIGKKHQPAAPPANESTAPARQLASVSPSPGLVEPVNRQQSGPQETPKVPVTTLVQASEPNQSPVVPPSSASAAVRAPSLAGSALSPAPSAAPGRTEPQALESNANLPAPSTPAPRPALRGSLAENSTPAAPPKPGEAPSARPPGTSALPASVAVAQPARNPSNRLLIWLTGGVLLAAGLAALWVWRRRTRVSAEMSLITESIDRRKR